MTNDDIKSEMREKLDGLQADKVTLAKRLRELNERIVELDQKIRATHTRSTSLLAKAG